MDEPESFDADMTELQECSYPASEALSQDDDDEVEELQKSLREVVQDHSLKPQLQCLMVDPSFSMVTVQSEDSGIVWETASSRCSTPWASETSSVSEGGSMEGPGAAGKITIIFDEEKVVRRRVRRLSDRFSRPGSSRSASALGVERPEMMEVSQPNVKQDKTEAEPDLEEIKSKDQQLFSLISEGYEILNIRVPSKLPTVDEEESTELQDNLSYLTQTPRIRSRNHVVTPAEDEGLQDADTRDEELKEASTHPPTDSSLKLGLTEGTGDIDYFEKFTLLDVVAPDEQAAEEQDEAVTPVPTPEPAQTTPKDPPKSLSPCPSEESFVLVSDADIVGEYLDEVFYGEGPPTDLVSKSNDEVNGGRMRRQSSIKESGSVLFESEETVLTPIYISSGPPKIIDPILLEEPTAMSFMYSDLYEDAVGERKRSDEEFSEAESVTSEKSYRRCLTDDCEEEDGGYLEKFTLKDETPMVEVPSEVENDCKGGRMMWPQNEFEMSGCLTRVAQEETVIETKGDAEGKALEPRELETESADELGKSQENENNKEALHREEEIGEKVTEEVQIDTHEPQSEFTESVKVVDEAEISGTKVQETAIDPGPVEVGPAGEVDILDEVDVCTNTPAPVTEIPETVIQEVEETQAPESIVDAAITEAEPEIPTEALTVAPVEVSTDCEPPVHAHVEVIDKGERAIQTQVCIDLKEENIEMDPAAKESTVKVEDLVDPTKAATKEEVEVNLVEIPEKAAEQKQEVIGEAKLESNAGGVKEMVSVGDEFMILVPKGEAVEMDIEVSLEPENSVPEQIEEYLEKEEETVKEASLDLMRVPQTEENDEISVKEEPLLKEESREVVAVEQEDLEKTEEMVKEASFDLTSVPQTAENDETSVKEELLPTEESPEAVQADLEKTEEMVKEASLDLTSVLQTAEIEATRVEKELLPTEESQEVVQVDLEKTEMLFSEPNTAPTAESQTTPTLEEEKVIMEEAVLIKAEAIQGPEQKDRKPEIVPLEPSSVAITEIKPTLEVEKKGGIVIEADAQTIENEPASEETHLAEQEPLYVPKEEMPIPILETQIIETTPQLEEKDGNEDLTTLAVAESHDIEHIINVSEILPEHEENIEVVTGDAELKPAAEEFQKATPFVSKETSEQEMSCTAAELEGEIEEFDFEIVPQHEDKASQQDEPEEPEHELVEQTVSVSKDQEGSTEHKVEDAEGETQAGDQEEEAVVLSTLKRFTPLEDLSGLPPEEMDLDIPDPQPFTQDIEMDVTKDAVVVRMQEDVPQTECESSDVAMEEYEMITAQDTAEIVEMELEKTETVKDEMMPEEEVLEVTTDDMEVDYETIDPEEERQARLAAELEGLDWYCVTCGGLLLEEEGRSEPHQGHEVAAVDQAYDHIMDRVSDWISELQGRSENIEDLVSELELAYNSVEDQFHESEAVMQAQNEEMMALVMEQYNSMSVSMEEEKKAKLEQLYDQIVSFQESIDSAKGTLETTAREADADARSPEDIHARLTAALDSAMSLELGPKGLLVFEDYAKGNTSSSQLAQRKGIPVPQRPALQAQEPGSATSSSVIVYWKVNPEDIIDCFQVYCMEDPQGAISEEYRVTVKESYCVLEELEPERTYKVWVMAVNYTGCSLPSERLIFKTAPSVPAIITESCTVLWDRATLRWSSEQQTPGLSYTLEYCRQYELEGEGLRTISGIKTFEQEVLLQPNENYLFYIKAVNDAGASEQSEAALISTKGTRFHLLKSTAHPALELSLDQTTVHYPQESHENLTDEACPLVLGEQLPVRGHYYWENEVSRSADYRLGVALSSASRESPLGESQWSWCLQCTATSTGGSYHLVHHGVRSSLFVIDAPERVGVFLDFQMGRLSFFNALSGQLLGSFCESFPQPCHPAVGLGAPGSVELCMVQELPEFVKDS